MVLNFLKKKEEDKTKSIERDIGFVEDAFEMCKDMIAFEGHSLGSFMETEDPRFLEEMSWMRKIRTHYLNLIAKSEVAQDWCFTPETKIISFGEVKDIKDIKIGDLVLTHKHRFRPVMDVSKRNISEEIVNINTFYSNIPIRVTKNHLFLVAENVRTKQKDSWKKNFKVKELVWKEASKITEKDFLYIPFYNENKDIDIFNCIYERDGKIFDSLDVNLNFSVMRLIGLYLAEGHHSEGINKETSKYPGWHHEYIGLSFGKDEIDFSDFVIKTIKEEFGIDTKPQYRKSTIEFSISKRIICSFFKQFGNNAHSKKIPNWIINLPAKKIIPLIRGMFEGDGNKSDYSFNYSTVSRELAYGLRLLLIKLGILSSIKNTGFDKDSMIDGRKIISKHERYIVSISGDSARKFAKLVCFDYNGGKKTSGNFGYVGENFLLIPIKNIRFVNYFGEVYNLHVKEDESYCTFQGIAHNCRSKHLCRIAMGLQELCTRFLSIGDMENAKKCAIDAKEMYLTFLRINGYKEEDLNKSDSSA
jgi:intein/homing endonuclease